MEPITQPNYLDQLNPAQRQAVETTDGPLLVLAGAGTGKTRVLVTRLSHILLQQKAWPSQVLAVTFTNKAALEMKERIGAMIGQNLQGMWLGTFHSIGARFLRQHGELVGLQPNFTIMNADDQVRLIKQLLEFIHVDDKKLTPAYCTHMINKWKDQGLSPSQINPNRHGIDDRLVKLYDLYEERLKVLNTVDFGDLLMKCLHLFQKEPEVLGFYQDKFKYILVDEYQDTNVAQYLLLRLLAQKTHNICCVGDDDQSIYSWRGAEVTNILRFDKDFPGAVTIRLEQNYRSTPHILAAASGLIAHNKGRLGKTLWTDQAGGEPVCLKGVWNGAEEARWIGGEIEGLQRKGTKLSQMAILVRAGFQTREFEEAFLSLAIPYKIIGGPRFYERQEIRDAIAYCRLVVQPQDDLAFERIINVPKRGIGETSVKKLHQQAREEGKCLYEISRTALQTDELKGKARTSMMEFLRQMDYWRTLVRTMTPDALVKLILDESGYTTHWQSQKTLEASGRLENLKELVTAIAEFETLETFLEHVSLVMETTTSAAQDVVTVMTMHSAKGLEFDIVFLAGWEEGIFPSQKTIMDGGEKELEEERRLAYVGLTRAKKQAYITFAANRQLYGQWQNNVPSRFIGELPPANVLVLSNSFMRGGSTGANNSQINGQARTISSGSSPFSKFKRSQRVFHEKFGYGRVQEVEGDRLLVHFEHSGLKRVMDGYVKGA